MKFRSTLYGSGKFGNIVGYKGWDGEYFIRRYVAHPYNPRTPAQLAQRQRITVLSQALSFFSNWAKEMFVHSTKNSAYARLLKLNYNNNVFTDAYPNIKVDYSKLIVSKGKIALPFDINYSLDHNKITCTWYNTTEETDALEDDKVCVFFMNVQRNEAFYRVNLVDRSSGRFYLRLPDWTGSKAHMYFAMKRTAAGTNHYPSNSVYLGEIEFI